MLANLIVQHSTDYAFTRLCDSWEDDTSNPALPSVAYTIYHDDIVTPELVTALMQANIPLLRTTAVSWTPLLMHSPVAVRIPSRAVTSTRSPTSTLL